MEVKQMKCKQAEHAGGFKVMGQERLSALTATLESVHTPREGQTASAIRRALLDTLYKEGWSGKAKLVSGSGISITSFRDGIGLCLQTGNMSRFYADLLKLQLLFVRHKIIAASFILFTRASAKQLGDNLAHFERLNKELEIFSATITVPLVLFGIDLQDHPLKQGVTPSWN